MNAIGYLILFAIFLFAGYSSINQRIYNNQIISDGFLEPAIVTQKAKGCFDSYRYRNYVQIRVKEEKMPIQVSYEDCVNLKEGDTIYVRYLSGKGLLRYSNDARVSGYYFEFVLFGLSLLSLLGFIASLKKRKL